MTSVRLSIQKDLVARLAAIGDDWTARLRDVDNREENAPIVATVYQVDEDKRIVGNTAYDATLQVGIEIVARREDAHPTTDAGNAYSYLDRLVVMVEKKIHEPDGWGENNRFEVNGHSTDDVVGDPTSVVAYVLVTFTYRHAATDPEVAV